MAAVLNHNEFGAGNLACKSLMLLNRTPRILPTNHDISRNGDFGQKRARIGACEQSLLLSGKNIGCRAADHVAQRADKGWIFLAIGMEHGWQPCVDQRGIAFLARKFNQRHALVGLAFNGRTVENARELRYRAATAAIGVTKRSGNAETPACMRRATLPRNARAV